METREATIARSASTKPSSDVMRAIVLNAPGRAEVREMPLPAPGAGEVRIRLEGCGVCGSNLPVWEGRPWFEYPLAPGAPGHEGWGTIDAVGDDVSGLKNGDRVAAMTFHAFASHDLARVDSVVTVPDALDAAFPGEPLACAVNVIRRARIEPGQRVAVVGVGFLGAMLTQLAVHAGARVAAISRREFALEVATECGAEATARFGALDSVKSQLKSVAPDGFDCVIEAVGNQEALDLASGLVRVRGRLVIAGFHQDGLRQVNMQDWNWRGIDVINAHERDPGVYVDGLREAIRLVDSGVWHPHRLFTHAFALEELPEAMDAMRRRPDGFLKALVMS